MIDIIITINEYSNELIKTLGSISFQNYKGTINVIIVSNNVKINKSDLEIFTNLNITFVDSNKNCSISELRNIGISKSSSDFIMFMNSGDYFYDCFALLNLLTLNKYDLINGKIAISHNDKIDYYDYYNKSVFGYIYKREIIEKYKLNFIDSIYSDLLFNKLFSMCKPKNITCKKNVYFYHEVNVKDNLKEYCDGFNLIINEGINKKLDNNMITKTIYSCLMYLYNDYCINGDKNIFNYSKNLYDLYLNYDSFITNKEKDKILVDYRKDIKYKYSFDEFLKMYVN